MECNSRCSFARQAAWAVEEATMVPGYYWLEVEANNQSGSVTTKVNTLDVIHGPITSASLRAHVMLLNINHTAAQDSFAADCFISRYRQSGIYHSGHWR